MDILYSKIPKEVLSIESFRKREMKTENIINRFRAGFLFLIILSAAIGLIAKDQAKIFDMAIHSFLLFLLILSPVLILIHVLSKKGKYYPWLKYGTVFLDLTVIFLLTFGMIKTTPELLNITRTDFALLMTIVFIFFSLLSVLRLNQKAIFLSFILATLYNVLIYISIDEFIMLGLFIALLLIILHVFVLWASNYILHYFLLSNKITTSFNELKDAHYQINQKNEEITSQKEEINNHLVNLEQAYSELSDSIIYAKKIQNATINNSSVLTNNLPDHFVFFKPKSIVSGDFFWASDQGDKIMFALADCTGHGVPGAFMTMLGSSLLNDIINKNKNTEPNVILNILRQNIIDLLHQDGKLYQPKDGMDMVLLQIDKKNKKVLFSGANNSFCYISRSVDKEHGRIIEFKGDRMPISFHYKMRNFSQLELSYEEGDKIYVYTDGYIDQFGGPKGKKFKSVPFKRMLFKNHTKPMDEQFSVLEETLNYWIKHKYEQIDDITVVGIEL